MHVTLVEEIMSTPVEVLQIGDTVALAERLMRAGRIRRLPVVDGEQRLIGLITHRKPSISSGKRIRVIRFS